jgi:hypothetical protein
MVSLSNHKSGNYNRKRIYVTYNSSVSYPLFNKATGEIDKFGIAISPVLGVTLATREKTALTLPDAVASTDRGNPPLLFYP